MIAHVDPDRRCCRRPARTRAPGGTRSSFAWTSSGSSPISSRKSVPPSASSNRPSLRCSAPVNAPFSWPKSSLSTSAGGIAPQFTFTNGRVPPRASARGSRARRAPCRCRSRRGRGPSRRSARPPPPSPARRGAAGSHRRSPRAASRGAPRGGPRSPRGAFRRSTFSNSCGLDGGRRLRGEDAEDAELLRRPGPAPEDAEHALQLAVEQERVPRVPAEPVLRDPRQVPRHSLRREVAHEERLARLRDPPSEEHSERHRVVRAREVLEDPGARAQVERRRAGHRRLGRLAAAHRARGVLLPQPDPGERGLGVRDQPADNRAEHVLEPAVHRHLLRDAPEQLRCPLAPSPRIAVAPIALIASPRFRLPQARGGSAMGDSCPCVNPSPADRCAQGARLSRREPSARGPARAPSSRIAPVPARQPVSPGTGFPASPPTQSSRRPQSPRCTEGQCDDELA